MSKTTTKVVKPIRSLQKFNQGDTVNSITLTGETSLAEITSDNLGDVELKLKRDGTKIDTVVTSSELLTVEKYGTKLTLGIDIEKLKDVIDSMRPIPM